MDECVFCKIIKGELPTSKVYEDDEFVAFGDINPKAPVHVLVVPKIHIEVNQLTEAVAGKWLMTSGVVAKNLGISQAYQLKIHVGKGAGQEVDHVHMHVLGGWREEV